MIRIELTMHELMEAATCGVLRRITSIRDRRDKNLHARVSDWTTDIDGACAEKAVAKWRGVYWDGGVGTFKAADLPGLHVRSTPHRGGHLIVRPNDDYSPDALFVLVITAAPLFLLAGWQHCSYAKREQFWRAGRNGEAAAWWVPQAMLFPMEELDGYAAQHDQGRARGPDPAGKAA